MRKGFKLSLKDQSGTSLVNIVIGMAMTMTIASAAMSTIANYGKARRALDHKIANKSTSEKMLNRVAVLFDARKRHAVVSNTNGQRDRLNLVTVTPNLLRFTSKDKVHEFETRCIREEGYPEDSALNQRCVACGRDQKQVIVYRNAPVGTTNFTQQWSFPEVPPPNQPNRYKNIAVSMCFSGDDNDKMLTAVVDVGYAKGADEANPSIEEVFTSKKVLNKNSLSSSRIMLRDL